MLLEKTRQEFVKVLLIARQVMIDRMERMQLEKTREEFVKGLRIIIKEGYSSQTVTKYAFNFYLNHKLSDKELYDLVYEIMMIDAGPEFELSEIELIKLVEDKLGINIRDTQEE